MKKIVVHVREDGHERVEEVLEGLHYTVSLVQNVYQITIYTPDENLDELIEKIQSVLDLRYNENMIEARHRSSSSRHPETRRKRPRRMKRRPRSRRWSTRSRVTANSISKNSR